jgi:hypothetical protein
MIKYMDITEYGDRLPGPRDEKGNLVEIMETRLNSVEKLNQIVLQIFTRDEIMDLNDKRCTLNCYISSSGKIISASISFIDKEPNVSLSKLLKLSQQVKENLTMSLSWNCDSNAKVEGYIYLSFLACKNLIRK